MRENTIIEIHLYERAKSLENRYKEIAERMNTACCEVCGGKDFVQKFRNVVGKIEGSMHGYFSLFGGSVSGSINGETSTLPVLSCRNCGNERKVATYNSVSLHNLFWDDITPFYWGVYHAKPEKFKDIPKIYLENAKETKQFALNHRRYDYTFYNEITDWSAKTWIKAGFKINKKVVTRFKFLWWEFKQEIYDF